MSLKLFEAVKTILSDIELFLTISLKTVTLPKTVVTSKEDLLAKLQGLRYEFPQLDAETREKTLDTVNITERTSKCESQEIYDDIYDDTKQEENIKQASNSSDVCEVLSLSAVDLSPTASMSGNLIRKNIGKSKVDLKNIFLSVFGKKYCLVREGLFFFYDKLSSKRANGSFPLRGYEARVISDQCSKKEFCFELVCPGQKSYIFAATTHEETDKWVFALNKESLKTPDARLSVFCDEKSTPEDEDMEYEDPSSVALKPMVPESFSRFPPAVEDEVYDDVAPNMNFNISECIDGRNSSDDGEIYDDAESKPTKDFQPMEKDDLLYEAFDATDVSDSLVSNATDVLLGKMLHRDGEIPYEKLYYGKWNCNADSENELTFKRGDIIEVISHDYDKFGWWIGCLQGVIGLVPKEYVTPAYERIHG